MYSVLYAVLLQPLPFFQPDRLVAVSEKPWNPLSIPTIQDWQHRGHAFPSIAAFTSWTPKVESSAGAGPSETELVSQNFLNMLGIGLALGRDFAQTGQERDCFGEAIVSDAYWRRMGGGRSLVGRTLRLDGRTYAITGVLPASAALEEFDALDEPSILTPIGCDPQKSPDNRGDGAFRAIARLRPGVSIGAARAELATIQGSLTHDYPNDYPKTPNLVLTPMRDFMAGMSTRSSLLAAMAGCGTLLLISCANLTNLLLARNTRRRPEFALRASLGASPRHLLLQLLAENCVLTVAGACAGMGIALLLVRVVRDIHTLHLSRLSQTQMNGQALAFAGLVTGLITLLLTVLPAARTQRPGLLADLSYGAARSSSASRGVRRAGRLLVAAQIAMAVVLVACAGWMVSSVLILLHQPLGFDPDHLVIASTSLHVLGVADNPTKTLATLEQMLTEVRSLPGVVDVAAANDKPLGGRINRYGFCSDTHPEDCKKLSYDNPDVFLVTPGYFRTIGQELYRGRDFLSADDGRNHVAIVNHALAEQQWPGQNPMGHRIYSGDLHAWATVVGEVADVHSYSLERAPVPNLYLPEEDGPDTSMTLMIRTDGNPTSLDEIARRTLRRHGEITTRYVESMPELMAHQVALRSFSMWVAMAFGFLAVTLATVGTYGLLAYEISLREREIGLRLALGSSRPAIVSLLLRQESVWIVSGTLAGLASSAAAGYVLRASFFHTGAASIPVLLAAALLLMLPALAAVAIPGRRASLIDPALTLRCE